MNTGGRIHLAPIGSGLLSSIRSAPGEQQGQNYSEKLRLQTEHGVDATVARGPGSRLLEHRKRNRGLLGDRLRSHRLLHTKLMRGVRRSTGSCDARGSSVRLRTKLLEIGEVVRLFRARLNGGKRQVYLML